MPTPAQIIGEYLRRQVMEKQEIYGPDLTQHALNPEMGEPVYEPSRMAEEIVARIIECWRAREWFFEYTEDMSKEHFASFSRDAQREIDDWDNER
jgi:hypothetical protein